MKRSIFIACMAIILAIAPFLSCNKAGDIPDEKNLQLTAPSGEQIAVSASDLKAKMSAVIAKNFGAKKDFRVTGIEYLNTGKGYAALISYELSDGTAGSFLRVKGLKYTIASQSVTVVPGDAGSREAYIFCRLISGTCNCKVTSVVIDTEAGTITVGCNCPDQCQPNISFES